MYSRLGNHDFEVCVMPPSNPPTSVGIFQFKGVFIVKSIWSYVSYIGYLHASNCKGRRQCYFSFFLEKNKSDKTI